MSFIPPRYEVPLVDQRTGRISLEWYKFLVPLAKKAIASDLAINTTSPISGGGALTTDLTLSLDANGVSNAFLAKMAAHTIKGNATGGTAVAEDLTGTQVTALLDAFTATLRGLAPLSGGGNSNLLRSDGTWTNSVDASLSAGTYLQSGAVLVAALPVPSVVGVGARYMVTDATVTTFASVVVGLGANTVPIFSDGTNWRIG